MDTYYCLEELSWLTAQEDCSARVPKECLNGFNQSFLVVEASEDLPQACMPDSVKGPLQISKDVEQIALVLWLPLFGKSITSDRVHSFGHSFVS